jgi:hypothetical protein
MVRNPANNSVRVEDYLTVLAAAAGEAVFAATGFMDVNTPREGLNPGSAIFGAQTNVLLTGDEATFREAKQGSVAWQLMSLTGPELFARTDFAVVDDVIGLTATTAGQVEWGAVVTTVPEANKPRVLPLRAALEMRPYVDQVQEALGLPIERRYVPCVRALAAAMRETRYAIMPEIAIALSVQVMFAMAKTVPVPLG